MLAQREISDLLFLLAHLGYAHLQDLFKESKGLPSFLLNEMISLVITSDNFESYVDIFMISPMNGN